MPLPWCAHPSQDPVSPDLVTRQSRVMKPCVPTTTPSQTTARSSVHCSARKDARLPQWYCVKRSGRASGGVSVHGVLNGISSGGCTPRRARSTSATLFSSEIPRSSSDPARMRRPRTG